MELALPERFDTRQALRYLGISAEEPDSATRALLRRAERTLRAAAGLPVVLRDERGTTVTAHRYLNDTDTRGKRRKAVVDAVAAVIILQDYLDYRRLHKDGDAQ